MTYTFAFKSTTLVSGRVVVRNGEAKVETRSVDIAENQGAEATLDAATAAIAEGARVIILPTVMMPTVRKVLAFYRSGGTDGGLTDRQREIFSADYVQKLSVFAQEAVKRSVRVENAQSVYRLTFGVIAGAVNGEEVHLDAEGYGELANGETIQCRNFSRIIEGNYKLSVDRNGAVTTPRLYRFDAEKAVTGKELLKAFIDGDYTPETDSAVGNINRLMLIAAVNSKLPKAACVARDTLATLKG